MPTWTSSTKKYISQCEVRPKTRMKRKKRGQMTSLTSTVGFGLVTTVQTEGKTFFFFSLLYILSGGRSIQILLLK